MESRSCSRGIQPSADHRQVQNIYDKRFAIIRNGRLVDARRRLAEPADILIKGDTILSVGPSGLDAPDGATLIDASDRALMPGLVNAHVHGHGTLAKGLVGDRWPLELFLNAMPGMAGNRTIEDKYLNGLMAAVEMIRKGCTACYDLFFDSRSRASKVSARWAAPIATPACGR